MQVVKGRSVEPIVASGDEKGGYVFTEEMLELAPFAKLSATGPEDPLENKKTSIVFNVCCAGETFL